MLCTGAYPTDHQTSPSTNSYNNQLQSNDGISYQASRDHDYPNHVDLNRVKHVQSYFESDHIIPNRTELRAQTPNYIFQLHQRHMNQWWNFDQLETNHLPHPIRAHMGDGKSRWNRRSLGAITAVRHHKHIGTFEDVSASNHPFARPSVAHFPAGSHLRGHRLMFRLAEMPEDEQLIAASLRLRYDPITSRNSSGPTERIRTHCRQAAVNQPHHYWPITLWLHYDMHKYRPARWDLETIASFEPDTLTCEVENQTVMHLPPGWFHIPLSAPILSLLQKINFRTNPDKYVTIRVRSLTHRPEGYDPLDQLKLYPKSREPKHLNDWLHEAPHLFTYHRDSEMDTEKKRTRRSVQEVYNTNSHQKALNSEDLHAPKSKAFQHKPPVTEARMDLRTRATRGTSFEQRYRKLQRMLHSGLRKAGQKHRPRRRAFYPRRNSRASPDNWHDPAATNVAPYYYASSRNPHMDAVAQNEYNELKDGFHGQNMANDNTDVYGSSPAVNGFDESVNIEPSSQLGTDDYLDSTCQRRDLIIDFDAVGWAGWVIAPQAYNARYCRGQCPFPLSTHYNTTNHAVLLQLVHLLDAARISGPCCVPNQLSSQSLLYHKQNGDVVLRVYQDMVVESCACR